MNRYTTNNTQELIAQTMAAIDNAANAARAADAATDPTIALQAEGLAYETASIVTTLVTRLSGIAADKVTTSQNLSEIAAVIKASRAIKDAGQTAARYTRRRSERTELLKFSNRVATPRPKTQPVVRIERNIVVVPRRTRKPAKS